MESQRVEAARLEREGQTVEYDEFDNPIVTAGSGLGLDKKNNMKMLKKVDHRKIQYEPFTKNFYKEHYNVTSLSAIEVQNLRVLFIFA
jgi:hypothetical protein